MIIQNKDQLQKLTWEDLGSSFHFQLRENTHLLIEKVVRLVPKRRLVGFCVWENKPAIIKLFFDKKNAKKHQIKDVSGIKILQDHHVPSPNIYFQDSINDNIFIVIYERLVDAINLEELWLQSVDQDKPRLLKPMIKELATQHVFGIVQNDLHLNNFLMHQQKIFCLDGGCIAFSKTRLERKKSIDNIALFLSQLGVGIQSLQMNLFQYYAKLRGWIIKQKDIDLLNVSIEQYNKKRLIQFKKKLTRDSSHFATIKQASLSGMADRDYCTPLFLKYLLDPHLFFNHPEVDILKNGGSSTVIKLRLEQKTFVIKRYNLKNKWHWLRRCFRQTRASHVWRIAQLLRLFNITTAKPIAYLETKYFGLNSTAYFIAEYVSDKHLGQYILEYPHQKKILMKRTERLFQGLKQLNLTHGDLKITNILIDANQNPVFIDLDGTKRHNLSWMLNHEWKKETKRFLRNFE